MKKIASIALMLIICVSIFCACDNGTTAPTNPVGNVAASQKKRAVFKGEKSIEIGERLSVTKSLDVELKEITTTDVIKPLMYADYSYVNEDSESTLVDVVFEIENVGDAAINGQEIAIILAKGKNEVVYGGARYFLEYDAYTSLAEHTSVQSGEKTRFHAVLYVPKDETNVEITVKFGEAELKYQYAVGSVVKKVTETSLGEKLEATDKSITIEAVSFAGELHPSNVGEGSYTFMVAEGNKNTYMIIEATCENNTSEGIDAYDFAMLEPFSTEALKMGKWVCETEDGSDFAKEAAIGANSSVKAYYIVEIPETEIMADYSLKIVFDMEEYLCDI